MARLIRYAPWMPETPVAPLSVSSHRRTVHEATSAPIKTRRAAVVLVAVLAAVGGCRAEGPTRPDLVLLTIDALAADRLGCFGGPPDAGRSLCALSEGGTLFAWTAAAPRGEASAAATVLTGLEVVHHGLADDGRSFLPEAVTTLAERFSNTGYRTAAFVASPRLNRSRRLDQGFEHYDDAAAAGPRTGASRDPDEQDASIALANRIQHWFSTRDAPRFVWIHADRDAGLAQLDRLLSRLAQTLDPETRRPGLLFAALRGEPDGPEGTLDWRVLRIPLFWRPPGEARASRPRVSQRLASLHDVAITLAGAARSARGRSATETETGGVIGVGNEPDFRGRDLNQLATESAAAPERAMGGEARSDRPERFVFLETSSPRSEGEVGIASAQHVYVRQRSPLDGTGHPVPTEQLRYRGARFAALPILDRLRHPAPRSAALEPGPWRTDVLHAESPVPRLEFHLARRLAAHETVPSTRRPEPDAPH